MEPAGRSELLGLYERIDARCREILEARPDWPCARGCDGCCRRLAEPPRATAAEWGLLLEGFARLDAAARGKVRERLAALSERPFTCPLLDEATGACRVYATRLAACRTYGFFRSGEAGLWCGRVRELADGAGELVFGNQDALEARLTASFGPAIGMAEAFAAFANGRG